CVSITDSQGAAVVDNGDVPASEPEVGYPAGNFVITRTGNGDTEINIRGAWAEGSNTQEVWRRWHLNHLDYDMGFDGPHDLLVWALGGFESYSSLVDTTQELTLNENLAEVDGLTIEYTVGIWDNDEFVKTFGTDSGLYTVSDDGLSITSNAAAMAEQDISDLRVIAQAKLGDTILCESHNDFWFHLRRAEEYYDLNRDESMIIGWWNRIDRQRDAFVRNPDYPDGAHVPFQITNVEVEQHPVRSVERVIDLKKVYENDDETSENYWWEYWAVGYGSAELEVTYIDVSGATRTHKFSVSVTADVYNVDVWADGSGMTMPGGSVTLQAEGIHHRDYGEDTQENLTYQWEIDQDLIEQGICQLVVDENDPSRATVTFAATPDHGAQLYWREAWVTVHLIDEGFEFAENTINVICCSDYEEVWPAILDRNLDVNQSITVTPEVRHYCASFLEEDDPHEYEVVEGATFSWDYDENAFNVVDNGAGSYTITRLAHWPVQLRLFADWTDGDGNHRHEDRTYPMNYLGEPSSLDNATFSEIPDQTYSGSALTPAVTLTDGDKTLVEDTDYTLAYDANINAGTAKVTATGMGNYQGTVSTTFTILPKSLEDATVTIGNKYYTGNEVTPVPTVKDGETALVKDTDFTVTYINNVKVGKATATITGTGNYTGEVTKYFKVVGQVSKATVSAVANQTYTGKAITPAPTVKFGNTTLKNGTHYTLTYANNTKPGEATITIKGKGYYNGTKTVTFKITAPITKATVSAVKNQAYTGKEIKPSPTIKFAGVTLKKGTDYTLTYKDNKKAGTATITIKGKGFYTGSRTVTFKITATGTWKKSGSKWWYCYTNGDYPYLQFLDIDGCRYYFDKNGYMVTGWQQIGSDWYYFRSDGKMAGGWFKSGSSWYYLIPSGADAGKMAVGWHKIDGKYYYFYSSGVMAVNTKIGNYTVGADGARK
ncbi:MAG: hypothetical protein Q4D48_02650, partial [Coriobacteriales bacterium]|nr:hypothetical protein [Coriobacteriales bacterium]